MRNNTKKQILKILENFKISRDELNTCLADGYVKESRMPEFITRKKNPFPLKSTAVQSLMWEKYGIPHQIFDNLEKYIEEGDQPLTEKAS